MTIETEHDWARDTDPLFTFLGLYLSIFQWIEGELDLIILFAAGFENWEDTQGRLARMDNNAKVKAAATAAIDNAAFPLVGSIEGWEAAWRAPPRASTRKGADATASCTRSS
jgi:hypothetical protein